MARTKKEVLDVEIVGEEGSEAVVPNPKPKRKSPPRPDKAIQVSGEKNRKYVANAMSMWDWETPDMDDVEAVEQRIKDYFNLCIETEVRPSIEGLSFAFGVCRRTYLNWMKGDVKTKMKAMPALKKAYNILAIQMANYMQNGDVNPVSGIFLMTNNHGYQNRAELSVRPESPLDQHTDKPELEEKYKQNQYIDATFNELDDEDKS